MCTCANCSRSKRAEEEWTEADWEERLQERIAIQIYLGKMPAKEAETEARLKIRMERLKVTMAKVEEQERLAKASAKASEKVKREVVVKNEDDQAFFPGLEPERAAFMGG